MAGKLQACDSLSKWSSHELLNTQLEPCYDSKGFHPHFKSVIYEFIKRLSEINLDAFFRELCS